VSAGRVRERVDVRSTVDHRQLVSVVWRKSRSLLPNQMTPPERRSASRAVTFNKLVDPGTAGDVFNYLRPERIRTSGAVA